MGMIGFARLDLVSTGADAISALCSKEYDIVILDVEMRGASGFYLARTLRKHCDRTMRVQPLVIVCTGLLPFCYAGDRNPQRCRLLVLQTSLKGPPPPRVHRQCDHLRSRLPVAWKAFSTRKPRLPGVVFHE